MNRGRADAEMTWGDETAGDTSKFDVEVLPPAAVEDIEASGILGVGRGAPEVNPSAEGAGAAAVEGSVGNAAWKRRLSPSHRQAVRTFFSKNE